jgi:hypothetical protein
MTRLNYLHKYLKDTKNLLDIGNYEDKLKVNMKSILFLFTDHMLNTHRKQHIFFVPNQGKCQEGMFKNIMLKARKGKNLGYKINN